MSAEQVTIVPSALELSFGDRLTEAVTRHNLHVVGRNLEHRHVLTYLEERVGASAIERPWDAFDQLTSTIAAADISASEDTAPGYFTAHIEFDHKEGRDEFKSFYRRLLAGISDPNMPELDPDGTHFLTAKNLSYADISTGGRVGQILFNRQYKDQKQNLRVLNGTAQTIDQSGVLREAPDELREWFELHHYGISTRIEESLPVTGQLGIVGQAMRSELAARGLSQDVQRPKGNRPFIEARATFKAKITEDEKGRAGAATSVTGLGTELSQQATAPFRELLDKAREREWAPLGREVIDTATGGFGLMQLGEVITRVGVTAATRAFVPAVRSAVADAIVRHRQGHQ
ncbi:MAG TPA: hypothetical protein VLG11_04870 [Candidatus Saccharimonadales bacterium]|nr:hypothetical protein [Candidatus Saccharimonadales bacterium]